MSDGHKLLWRSSGKRYVHVLRVTRVGHYLKPMHDHKSRFRHRNCRNWGKSEVSLMRWWLRQVLVTINFWFMDIFQLPEITFHIRKLCCVQVIMTTTMKTRSACFRKKRKCLRFIHKRISASMCVRREYSSQPRCHTGSQGVMQWALYYFCNLLSSCCFIPEASHQVLC